MPSFIRKSKKTENYQDLIARLYDNHEVEYDEAGNPIPHNGLTRTCTLQVTDACNLRCTYCYQIAKNTHRMSFDIAKKYIDMLLEDDQENDYVNTKISNGLIVEFIGGEPLLEIDLIDKVTDYLYDRMLELNHPWLNKFMISICSNGVLYMDPRFQRYIEKNKYHLSFSISIDGNKELHDACRVFPDGSGSYDIAIEGVKHFREVHHGNMGSKMTIAPGNINKVYVAGVNLLNLGYEEIFLNCVYEDGWDAHYATILYQQLTKLADYIIDNDLFDKVYFSIFEDNNFCPMSPDDNDNWCGGTGSMLSCDYKGDLYPCIRYMESSLGNDAKPLIIGNVYDGLLKKPEEKEIIKCMRCVTRRSQSTDECFYCPIASGCSWCFRAGTMIETENGFVPIEDIKVGDKVMTQSGDYHEVTKNMVRTASEDETILIRVPFTEEIYTTSEHPFWVKKFIYYDRKTCRDVCADPTWVPAKNIEKGDYVFLHNREGRGKFAEMWVAVDDIRDAKESYEVYNMTVEGDPSYYANGVLVHNCSAYNYQTFGTVDKRATFICIMHKARALANVYYWNKGFRQYAPFFRFKNYVPDEWALEIISQDELNKLKELESFTDADIQSVLDYEVPEDTKIYEVYKNQCLEKGAPVLTNYGDRTTVKHDVVDVNGNVETTIEKS